jgi:hypothetical protein
MLSAISGPSDDSDCPMRMLHVYGHEETCRTVLWTHTSDSLYQETCMTVGIKKIRHIFFGVVLSKSICNY